MANTNYGNMIMGRMPELAQELDELAASKQIEYLELIDSMPPVRERTKEQQRQIDELLSEKLAAEYKRWHYGII